MGDVCGQEMARVTEDTSDSSTSQLCMHCVHCMQFNKCVCLAKSLSLKYESEDIDVNVLDTYSCEATRTMTSQGS